MALSAIEAMNEHDARIALERPITVGLIRIDLEKRYSKYPHDLEKLTTWGQDLVELSQFGTVTTATQMAKAMSKIHTALTIDPAMHKAVWCLGRAHNAMSWIIPYHDDTKIHFEKTFQYYRKALEMCPGNEDYRKSLRAYATISPEVSVKMVSLLKKGFSMLPTSTTPNNGSYNGQSLLCGGWGNRQIHKMLNNIKITILSGLATIPLICDTINVGSLYSDNDDEIQAVIEETNWIVGLHAQSGSYLALYLS
ncbi:hypothetical protein L1887_07698 [Cichorium endivia]|nr:hypothetical protein L1887_07698 [Cichorium endivia]